MRYLLLIVLLIGGCHTEDPRVLVKEEVRVVDPNHFIASIQAFDNWCQHNPQRCGELFAEAEYQKWIREGVVTE